MKALNWRTWLGAVTLGLAATLPAQADLITFEDLAPDLFGAGGSINSGGFNFASDGVGFSGVDSTDGFVFAAAPDSASGQFLFALNGDGIVMTSTLGSAFRLTSFSGTFVAPIPGLAGADPGLLYVDLYDLVGDLIGTEVFSFDLGTPGGNFPFATMGLDSAALLSSAHFRACVYQEDGTCAREGLISASFALDDINISFEGNAVPEPASLVLVLTALGAVAVRRRQSPL